MTHSVAQILFNSVIPEKYRDYRRDYSNPDTVPALLTTMAKELPPDEYRDVLRGVFKLGADVSYFEGASFGLNDLRTPPALRAERDKLLHKIEDIANRKDISKTKRDDLIIKTVSHDLDSLKSLMMDEALAADSGLARQVKSRSRGKIEDLQSLLLGDALMADGQGRVIPFPMLRSYSEGVSPAEYFAGAHGTRSGMLSVKLSTADSGYLAKRIKQVSHDQVITTDDCQTTNSIESDPRDAANIGAILSQDVGDLKAGTILTANDLKSIDADVINVRSPLTCHAQSGLCAKCVGIRETGEMPSIGDNIGMTAAQALSEKLTQQALSSKHSSGRTSGKKAPFISGFNLVEQMFSVPQSFKDAAAVAEEDGLVDRIEPAPHGGKFIHVGHRKYHIADNMTASVKPGDSVEAGDLMSDGIPDPSKLVKYKGIGETRRIFTEELRKATGANRRNAEVIGRGFIDYVRVTDPESFPNSSPDDVVRYSDIERSWVPRPQTRNLSPGSSVGKYLEVPIAHYSIGTKISRKVAQDLTRRGFKKVDVHDDLPPFEPVTVSSVRALSHSPDWQVRMGGYHLKDSLLDAASRGMTSDLQSTSYIPGLMRGTDFASELRTTGKY